MQEAPKLFIAVGDHLASPGDFFEKRGTFSLPNYRVGDHVFHLPKGVSYELELSHVGEGILLKGTIQATVETQCDCCLEEAKFDICSDLSVLYLFHEPSEPEDECEEDVEVLDSNKQIDVGDLIQQTLVLETPFVVTCKPDCKGLCPQCGKNLNEGLCTCEADELQVHPFAQLKDLKKTLENQEHNAE